MQLQHFHGRRCTYNSEALTKQFHIQASILSRTKDFQALSTSPKARWRKYTDTYIYTYMYSLTGILAEALAHMLADIIAQPSNVTYIHRELKHRI